MQEPLSFSVTHAGRGGSVTCRSPSGDVALPIEMGPGGEFSVWVRSARLTTAAGKVRRLEPQERELLGRELRAWLDATGRTRWVIER